ncbi:stage II sporulation protein R [Paenibacillus sp. UNCCL117]|uniref:stage II sporulation protein R n=1 Tax=unclassified Paenibacillus TaxID=185978 RepID=UPI00088EDB1A|nr:MULTISPECIES: stage II sporulation protein R [unclassified Paenibacillus]SDE33335.1 stage II sporulation protein R [Paenibacillus sp. cl123]SFW64004.1 stage II sporulation protein R [Paenibacillus sp. UNCCL117]
MVKRFGWKRYAYLGFALLMLLVSWESSRANAMLFTGAAKDASASGVIPAESIRLRILANSDSAADQWIKREVRDAIIERMNGWVTELDTLDKARAVVRDHLPELEATVGETLQANGFDYAYTVELGTVPFPTKMYGNQVYPAGDYEALRVSIGAAAGQNWWCVLFPPLCFVDSEMVVKKENKAHAAALDEEEQQPESEGPSDKKAADKKADDKKLAGKTNTDGAASVKEAQAAKRDNGKGQDGAAAAKPGKEKVQAGSSTAAAGQVEKQSGVADTEAAAAEKPEVRFFLWDMITKFVSWFA